MARIRLKAEEKPERVRLKVKETIVTRSRDDFYSGSYEVTPDTGGQVLSTKDKVMKEDITVKAIPVYETSNLYGTTIYIGGNETNG